jgi:hypothetical protein
MALSAKNRTLLDSYRKLFGYLPKKALRDMLIDRAVNRNNPGASKDDVREYLVNNGDLWDESLDNEETWTKLIETLKRENDF